MPLNHFFIWSKATLPLSAYCISREIIIGSEHGPKLRRAPGSLDMHYRFMEKFLHQLHRPFKTTPIMNIQTYCAIHSNVYIYFFQIIPCKFLFLSPIKTITFEAATPCKLVFTPLTCIAVVLWGMLINTWIKDEVHF